jgi:hypothetical protein
LDNECDISHTHIIIYKYFRMTTYEQVGRGSNRGKARRYVNFALINDEPSEVVAEGVVSMTLEDNESIAPMGPEPNGPRPGSHQDIRIAEGASITVVSDQESANPLLEKADQDKEELRSVVVEEKPNIIEQQVEKEKEEKKPPTPVRQQIIYRYVTLPQPYAGWQENLLNMLRGLQPGTDVSKPAYMGKVFSPMGDKPYFLGARYLLRVNQDAKVRSWFAALEGLIRHAKQAPMRDHETGEPIPFSWMDKARCGVRIHVKIRTVEDVFFNI